MLDDPIAAVTHPDPYPYYAALAAKPIHWNEALGLWVAAGAESVQEVLGSEVCRVRPPDEPVPKALVGSAAGEIFRHLVRMNDGAGRCPFKRALAGALDAVDAAHIAETSRRLASAHRGPASDLPFVLPAQVIASLLGLEDEALEEVPPLAAALVRCVFHGDEVEEGKRAAGRLVDLFRPRIEHGLLGALGAFDREAVIANGIGFLAQAYDPTAGLIGNTLLHPGATVEEVLRDDPPIHNTRRFLAADAVVGGVAMRKGDVILVVLAAAGAATQEGQTFAFGFGAHACPGRMMAVTIAEAGVAELRRRGVAVSATPRFRPLRNARVPIL